MRVTVSISSSKFVCLFGQCNMVMYLCIYECLMQIKQKWGTSTHIQIRPIPNKAKHSRWFDQAADGCYCFDCYFLLPGHRCFCQTSKFLKLIFMRFLQNFEELPFQSHLSACPYACSPRLIDFSRRKEEWWETYSSVMGFSSFGSTTFFLTGFFFWRTHSSY